MTKSRNCALVTGARSIRNASSQTVWRGRSLSYAKPSPPSPSSNGPASISTAPAAAPRAAGPAPAPAPPRRRLAVAPRPGGRVDARLGELERLEHRLVVLVL